MIIGFPKRKFKHRVMDFCILSAFRLVATAVILPVMFAPTLLWWVVYSVVDPADPLSRLVTIGAGFFFMGIFQVALGLVGVVILGGIWFTK